MHNYTTEDVTNETEYLKMAFKGENVNVLGIKTCMQKIDRETPRIAANWSTEKWKGTHTGELTQRETSRCSLSTHFIRVIR